ncbi:MAG: site-specific DNA-methyltransferase, partial [Clostridia bacterium]|nr:site-specific DNA-methyltransferase [Clostridia bacterium]
MESLNKTEDNIRKIRELFPNAVTEVERDGKLEYAVDFDVLKQELSSSLIEGNEERYQFTWPDKK